MGKTFFASIKRMCGGNQFLAIILTAFFVTCPALIAWAAMDLIRPLDLPPGSRNMGMHYHPIQKKMKMHTGQDVPAPAGTVIKNSAGVVSFVCLGDTGGGYGKQAEVIYECNVKVIYSHLSSCDAPSQTAKVGTTGNSTGNHLHYEVFLGNARVQPEQLGDSGGSTTAVDAGDLCLEETRKKLIDEANGILDGQSGKDGVVTPSQGVKSTTTVPADPSAPGITIDDGNGGTITIPPGGGYTITEDWDERITVTPEVGDSTEVPTLPPGTPPDLTPEGTEEHEVTGCATDTWKAMVNQSVMQARREMMFNQRFVAKADSVMAYSCLDEAMDRVRKDLGPVFSETKRWVNVEVDILGKTVTLNKELGEYSLDGALVSAAYNPYETWIRTNFSHEFLGGLTEEAESGGEEEGGENHSHDQSYAPCSTMQDVWKAAKCMNLKDEPMFPTFDQLIENSSDPRKYPHRYQCNYTGITQEMIDTAKGKEVKFDKVKTYLNMIYPDTAGKCFPAIKTGVTVVRQESKKQQGPISDFSDDMRISKEVTYTDGLCITAGCSYQKNADGGGECVLK